MVIPSYKYWRGRGSRKRLC